jgi:hypothetical protein
VLGHTDRSTTERYAKPDLDAAKRAMERFG